MAEDDPSGDYQISDDEVITQLGEHVFRISRRLRRSSAKRLEPFGLSDGQARVLRIVGRARPPLRMSDIAERRGIVPRSVTTVVEVLEAKALVVREVDAEDRRSILVRPTEAGLHLLDDLDRARDEAAAALFSQLSHGDRLELFRLLDALDMTPLERHLAQSGGGDRLAGEGEGFAEGSRR